MFSRIAGLLLGGSRSHLSVTPKEAFDNLNGRIADLTLQLEHAHRALQRAGELVETLGNGTSVCRLDSVPFKTEIGAQLEFLGNALIQMARHRVTDVELGNPVADRAASALQILHANTHRFNRTAAGTVCKNDAESMLYLAERLFVEADECQRMPVTARAEKIGGVHV